MTRRNYEQFAREIAASAAPDEYRYFAASICSNVFEADNPRFSHERFLEACGLQGEPPRDESEEAKRARKGMWPTRS